MSTHTKSLTYLDTITLAIVKRQKMDEGFKFLKSEVKMNETRALFQSVVWQGWLYLFGGFKDPKDLNNSSERHSIAQILKD